MNGGIILILLFLILLAFPGFYIITRKIVPHGRKKTAIWIAAGLTALAVVLLILVLRGTL